METKLTKDFGFVALVAFCSKLTAEEGKQRTAIAAWCPFPLISRLKSGVKNLRFKRTHRLGLA
jgi:hypothetical protein